MDSLIILDIIYDKDYLIHISPDSNLLDLKQKILSKLGEDINSEENFIFNFEWKSLYENNQLIKNLEIKNNSSIHVSKTLRGGALESSFLSYLDVVEGKMIKAKVSSKGNIELTVSPGLNLECICTNPNCDYHNKRVICPIGSGTFDFMASKRNHELTKCPICKMCAFSEN